MKKIVAVFVSLLISVSSVFATYPKVAVVLSGGGAKGFAQVAIVDEIQKMGIPIDFICGTSIGALIGGFYAAGYSSPEIIDLLREKNLLSLIFTSTKTVHSKKVNVFEDELQSSFSFGIGGDGLGDIPGVLGDQKILSFLSAHLLKIGSYNNFNELPIPFAVMTTDATEAIGHPIHSGSLVDAMRSSMSLPIVFPPYLLLDGTYCMDGGLINNLPVDLALEWGADIVISIDVSSSSLKKAGEYSTLSGVVEQTINIATFHNRGASQDESDLVILPDVNSFSILEVNKFEDILEKGYEAVDKIRPQLENLRDYIWANRPLSQYSKTGSYADIVTPIATYYKFVDVSKNLQPLVLTDMLTKYVGKRLDEKTLHNLNDDMEAFGRINNISSISYAFEPSTKGSNIGTLVFYFRDWETLESRVNINFDLYSGFSNQSNNMSWLDPKIEVEAFFNDVFDSKFDSRMHLSLSSILETSLQMDYNIISNKDLIINGFSSVSLKSGGLSPANSTQIKQHIPSFAIGSDIDFGFNLFWSNKLQIETLAEYQIINFSPSEMPSAVSPSSPLGYTYPLISSVGGKIGLTYSKYTPTIFAKEGFYTKLVGEVLSSNSSLNWAGEFVLRYSLPITKQDSLKFNAELKVANKNCQLMSSYYDLGSYSKMVGYHHYFLRRGYGLFGVTYQRDLGDLVAPMYFQIGVKALSYDSYNPYDNIFDSSTGKIMKCSSASVNPFSELDLGLYSGIGMDTAFGNLVLGLGVSIKGNFSVVLEFV